MSTNAGAASKPLSGLRVLELAAFGPVSFTGMMLADLGAAVVRIDRPEPPAVSEEARARADPLGRGKSSLGLDVRSEGASDVVLDVVAKTDVLVEGSRPGVVERLGIGPEPCLARNPALVYVRLTGYGQQGPMAQEPGHDINFVAVSGVLDAVGRAGQPPTPPLNLVADYGGGAMLAVVGALAAVLQAQRTGHGQVVDVAMCDGAMLLNSASYAFAPSGPRGTNLLDSGAPFYEVYECADGRHLAVGAVLDKFWLALLGVLGLSESATWRQRREADWPELKRKLAEVFARRTQVEWLDEFARVPACVTPVLRREELAAYPHHVARQALTRVDGVDLPAPAPRFGAGSQAAPEGAPIRGEHTVDLLRGIGYPRSRIDELLAAGTVYHP